MINRCTVLSLLAAAACALPVIAQEADHLPVGQGTLTVMPPEHPYNSRVVGLTYDNSSTIGSTGLYLFLSGTGKKVISHISFVGGPWDGATGRVITAIDYADCTTPAGSMQAQFTFYAESDVNFNGFSGEGTSMINPAAVPLGSPATGYNYRSGTHTYPANQGGLYTNAALTTAAPVPNGSNGVWVVATVIDPATGAQPTSTAAPGAFIMGNNTGATTTEPTGNPNNTSYADVASPGNTELSYGRDISNDGILAGRAVIPTPNADAVPSNGSGDGIHGAVATERRYIKGETAAGSGLFRAFNLAFGTRGDITAVAPICQTFTLGADNVFAADSTAMAANGVKWYCFTVPAGGAVDGASKYIDFDTETSGADAALGLFDSTGALIASDDDGGSGANSQMSFGIGRRAAIGDGAQYDGRYWNGLTNELGLGAGTYYLAAAASSTGAAFSDGWSVTGSGAAGTVTTRIRTNVTGGALDPSVPPPATRIVGLSLEDPIVAPGGQATPVALFGPGTLWWDVNLCRAADGSNAVSFDGSGSTYAHAMIIFNDSGNVVGQATGTDLVGALVSFGGANPALPSGHYYIGMTFDPTWDLAPAPSSAGRWHFRGRNGSAGFELQVAVSVPWPDCNTTNFCCRNDYNGDGDVGTDLDIENFFSCLGGTCCATCPPNADFNCDGDVGTDSDIEAFFRVLGGGSC